MPTPHKPSKFLLRTLAIIAIISLSVPSSFAYFTNAKKNNGSFATSSVTGLLEWYGNESVTAPLFWQSAPNHPTTTLTYITEAEMQLLKALDLHDSGVDVEDHFGPEGIPSLNGGGSYSQSSYSKPSGGGGRDSGQAAQRPSQSSYGSGAPTPTNTQRPSSNSGFGKAPASGSGGGGADSGQKANPSAGGASRAPGGAADSSSGARGDTGGRGGVGNDSGGRNGGNNQNPPSALSRAAAAVKDAAARASSYINAGVDAMRGLVTGAKKTAGTDTVGFADFPSLNQPAQPKPPTTKTDQLTGETRPVSVPNNIRSLVDKQKAGTMTPEQEKAYEQMNLEEAKRGFQKELAERAEGTYTSMDDAKREAESTYTSMDDAKREADLANAGEGDGNVPGGERENGPYDNDGGPRPDLNNGLQSIPTPSGPTPGGLSPEEAAKLPNLTYDPTTGLVRPASTPEKPKKDQERTAPETTPEEVTGQGQGIPKEQLNIFRMKNGENMDGTITVEMNPDGFKQKEERANKVASIKKDDKGTQVRIAYDANGKPKAASITFPSKEAADKYKETYPDQIKAEPKTKAPSQGEVKNEPATTKVQDPKTPADQNDRQLVADKLTIVNKAVTEREEAKNKLETLRGIDGITQKELSDVQDQIDNAQAKVNKSLSEYNQQFIDKKSPKELAQLNEYAKKINDENRKNLNSDTARLGQTPELSKAPNSPDNDLDLTDLQYEKQKYEREKGIESAYDFDRVYTPKVAQKIAENRLPVFGQAENGELVRVRDEISPYLNNLSDEQKKVAGAVANAAGSQKVDVRVALSIAAAESDFGKNPKTNDQDGYRGVMQIGTTEYNKQAAKNPALKELGINNMFANIKAGVVDMKARQKALADSGINPNLKNTYLSYNQGVAGAKALLKNPDMSAVEALVKGTKLTPAQALENVRQNLGKDRADEASTMTAKELAELVSDYPDKKIVQNFKLNESAPVANNEDVAETVDETGVKNTRSLKVNATTDDEDGSPANTESGNDTDAADNVAEQETTPATRPEHKNVSETFDEVTTIKDTDPTGVKFGKAVLKAGMPKTLLVAGDAAVGFFGGLGKLFGVDLSLSPGGTGRPVLSDEDRALGSGGGSGQINDANQDTQRKLDSSQFTSKQNAETLVNSVLTLNSSKVTAFIPSPDSSEAKAGLIRRITTTIDKTTYVVELRSRLTLSEKFIVVNATPNVSGAKVTFSYTDNDIDGSLDAFSANGVNLTGSAISKEVRNKFEEELRTLTNIYYKSL